mgnify:CR=1 FL=1
MKSKMVFRRDGLQTKALVRAGRVAGKRAFSASKALGLSVSYIKDGIIYEENADGTVVVKKVLATNIEVPFKVTKGLVLHAK